MRVKIHAGAKDGARSKLKGRGEPGPAGGEPGDLYVRTRVGAHRLFGRKGDDLTIELPLTFPEAALGAHVEVPTPDGPVTIELPAGTQNGQRFRLRKRGVPKLGEKGRGDLFVEARVVIPAVTEDRARDLLREFTRLHPEAPRRSGAAEKAS